MSTTLPVLRTALPCLVQPPNTPTLQILPTSSCLPFNTHSTEWVRPTDGFLSSSARDVPRPEEGRLGGYAWRSEIDFLYAALLLVPLGGKGMGGGAFVAAADGRRSGFEGKVTASVIITCVMAASGGLIFGYDVGISGGVTTMAPFLEKFFPGVLRKMADSSPNRYCVYDSQALTAFTSSLYIAGLLSSLVAGRATDAVGRRAIMLIGGAFFLSGAIVNGAAANIEMLIFGRLLLGTGVGFTNQAAPLYLAETAPTKWRGAFNTGFQFFIAIGVVAANLINYGAARIPHWGWRLSLGAAAVPAAILLLGASLISDTPSSLVSRGDIQGARLALRRARGPTADVDAELSHVVQTIEASRPKEGEQGPFRLILQRTYRQHLVMAMAIPFFQQMTGINVIAFYAPVLFQTAGFGSNSALIASAILGSVNLVSILVSTFAVDRCGRKVLFIQGGIQMIICQVAVAIIMAVEMGGDGSAAMSKGWSSAVLMLMCVYAAGFGWSWGPLSWLVPSEIFPAEIRSAGQSISVAVNFGVTFVLAQMFLAMLCRMKYGAFAFYAGWIAVMTIFVAVFLPETKGVPLESMHEVWAKHWYWKRFCQQKEGR